MGEGDKRTPLPLRLGIHRGVPDKDYHAWDALGSTGAKTLLRSPAHYRSMIDEPPERKTAGAFDFGTLVHMLVLEPDREADGIVLAPETDKRTKAGKEAWDAVTATGKLVVTQSDLDSARRCRDTIMAHPGARRLLTDFDSEVSVGWHDPTTGVPCKARFDAYRRGDLGIVDLKTTADASHDEFARSVVRYGYHVQAAHYMLGHEVVTGEAPPFYAWIAVEKVPPFAVATYSLRHDAWALGLDMVREAYARFADSIATGSWPAYSDLIQPLALPRYALRVNVERI